MAGRRSRGDGDVSPLNRIFLSPPDVGPLEREQLLAALDGGWVAPVGPDLDAFEDELAAMVGWPGVVAVSSGTAALHLALLAHGVGPGDTVLTSSFTFVASANAIGYCGARPAFVDSEPASWNMCPELLAGALADARRRNRLPKAVLVVDLYGQCAAYDDIVPQCLELGIPVIEDAAEAIGATYKGSPAGTLGTAGTFSFNGNKIMTTGGGGAFVSADVTLAARVRHLSTQARETALHYEHQEPGYNYRLSNLLAAVGRAQLRRLAAMSTRRREIHALYRRMLGGSAGIGFMPTPEWSGWNGWLTCVTFDDTEARDAAQRALEAENIESRPLWKPMHIQPLYAGYPAWLNGTSEDLFRRGLCLPSGSGLDDAQVERVASTIVGAAAPSCR